jgi:ATP-dependent Lhr-like helicase
MSEQSFKKLAPFLQDYIYKHRWSELRQVQQQACQVIFETDAHLLLAAGTAAGKTEAAFLPVLTLLHQQPSKSIGVLYIGPLKALINDQFDRLDGLLKAADIPVCPWHGDIPQSYKARLLKEPKGVLQITPESLESLLINKHSELERLFGDLRFVITDEIHAFMGSERGGQILCQLARLSPVMQTSPRRIGLSATLGDYSQAEEWLRSGTDRAVVTPEIAGGDRQVRLALEHFEIPREVEPPQPPDNKKRKQHLASPFLRGTGGGSVRGENLGKVPHPPNPPLSRGDVRNEGDLGGSQDLKTCPRSPYYQYIFDCSKARKCLIFANSRSQTESVIANLRQIATAEGMPDIYHVHHGSIAPRLREAAEAAMRDSTTPAVTAATLTLELGIDIGQLERVIQLNAPLSVASFLQRLGRTGRRGEPADMRFVCTEEEGNAEKPLPEQLPWQLLQAIAIIQLYIEERWIEPIPAVQYPFSLLYHQTMSILTAKGELSPAALAEQVLTLPTFAAIFPEDFRQLLHHLIAIDHLQPTAKGSLIIGLAGEKVVNRFQFYAVFQDNPEYSVRDDTMEIGSIVMPLPAENRFALAGRTWEVIDIDTKARIVYVKQVEGIARISWRGGSGTIHAKVLQRMRQVLLEDVQYPYLQPTAQSRLQAARHLAQNAELEYKNILPLKHNTYCIFPWMGTVAYHTLERYLSLFCRESLEIKNLRGLAPYFLTLRLGKDKLPVLQEELACFGDKRITEEDLVTAEDVLSQQKYDRFIPPTLLKKAFAVDSLNVEEMEKIINNW